MPLRTCACIVLAMEHTYSILRIRQDHVRVLREMRDLTNDQALADAMGVHRASVSRVMRGKSEPSTRFLGALCEALQASPNDLFVVDTRTDRNAA